jgi:acetyl-CoA acetyltransferase
MAHYAPFGLITPAAWVALHAPRFMSTYGVTDQDFGRIAAIDRAHAAANPDARFYQRPITLEDHQNSRGIVEPEVQIGSTNVRRDYVDDGIGPLFHRWVGH